MDTLDQAAVEALERQFADAVSRGDVETLVSMYDPDAVILPAGGKRIEGREAIEAFWRAGVSAAGGVKLTTTHVRTLAPGLVEETGEIRMTPPGGANPPPGKYLILWRRTGGEWLLTTDMWNFDE